ncbi:TPA: NAD(P)-dependent oxidoreductase, partial [Yersinia enterocolitica]|nr:NAD(P)-dependent oxidoreductase [Yersinia enterocolitica]
SLPSNINDYALTKNKFSLLAKKKCKENIKFIDLKLEHFFGPFDEPTKFTTYVIQGCKKDGNLKFTAGMQQRDFIYIIDLVNAFKCIISNLDKLRRNESISIGTGDVVTIRKFVETVANITEYKGILSFGEIPYRDNEVMLSYASLDRMKEFGWKCKFNLSDAIRDTLLREAC